MREALLYIAAGLGALALGTPQGRKIMQTVSDKKDLDLEFFKASEFGLWYPFMSRKLLLMDDEFRRRLGAPVLISAAGGALGRDDDPASNSQHNFIKWGEVRANDLMIPSMQTADDRREVVRIARQVGFTGIGLYPEWKPHQGIHVDVREDRQEGSPAMWAGLLDANGNQYYPSAGISAAYG